MRTRVFRKPGVLNEMLFLRLQGWPLGDLAFKYHCDKSSVWKACIRSGLPQEILLLPKPTITFHAVITDWDGQRINRGKSYREYLAEAKKKQPNSYAPYTTIHTHA